MHKNPTKSYLKKHPAQAPSSSWCKPTNRRKQWHCKLIEHVESPPSPLQCRLHDANLTPSCRLKPPPSQKRDAQLGSSLQPYNTLSPVNSNTKGPIRGGGFLLNPPHTGFNDYSQYVRCRLASNLSSKLAKFINSYTELIPCSFLGVWWKIIFLHVMWSNNVSLWSC